MDTKVLVTVLLFQAFIVMPIIMITTPLKMKKKYGKVAAELIRSAHLGKKYEQNIFWLKTVSTDDFYCPLTREQLENMRSCDRIVRHEVDVTVLGGKYARHDGYVLLKVSVDFQGFRGETEHCFAVDGAKVLFTYDFGDPGWYVKEIKQVS